ncbi:MAG: hypothetical protein DWP95_12595, partial [Proteobacteria bacterium]
MNINKLTTNFQQALNEAQSIAVGQDHNMIESAHVLQAMLQQQNSSLKHVLTKAGVNLNQLQQELENTISMMPVVSGPGDVGLSNNLNRVLNICDKLAQKRGDQYIASELFALALLQSSDTTAQLLKKAGASEDNIAAAIDSIRGGDQVTEQSAEENRQALEKYTIDLTARAEAAKIDPIIGRDAEIRRTIQILQRRTKNNPVIIGEPGV